VIGTCNYRTQYSKNQNDQAYDLLGYLDSDYSGDKDDRKSTAAYMFMIGNAAFLWCSKKESMVALSSCEVEYNAASNGSLSSSMDQYVTGWTKAKVEWEDGIDDW